MQNHVYTVQFYVQSLKVTKANECAPKQYPVSLEFRFRDNIFISIPQKDFGSYIDKTEEGINTGNENPYCRNLVGNYQNKNLVDVKSCAFTLSREVDSSDIFDVRAYKKKHDRCKFLIGMAEIPMKRHFDQLMAKYHAVNTPTFFNRLPVLPRKPNEGGQSISPLTPYPADEIPEDKKEVTEAEVEERKTKKTPKEESPTFGQDKRKEEFGLHTDKTPTKPDYPAHLVLKLQLQLRDMKNIGSGFLTILMRIACVGKSMCMEIPYPQAGAAPGGDEGKFLGGLHGPDLEDPCKKERRLYNESDQESSDSSSSYVSDEGESSISVPPTIKPRVDKTAYDEFEADLNGCGLAIRVLKNSHKVSGVKRYEDPASCNTCKTGGNDQKTAVARLLQLICRVLMSLNSEQDKPTQCENIINPCNKAPNLQEICQCIQRMLGSGKSFPNDKQKCSDDRLSMNKCGQKSWQSPRCKPDMPTRRKNLVDPCSNRRRAGCECDSQRGIMLFLESIRQVVANKKGLSDLADLLLQCTCGNGNDGGGDNKSGLTSILKIILEKIKNCADDRPPMEKQMDLCGLVRTLTELQNNGAPRKRGGETCSCTSDTTRSSIQSSENVSCLVKKILELGVKYCSNRNVNLRNILCKVLSDDVCNEELTNICRTICQYLESDRNVVCDHVRKETAGRVVNAPCLPEVRGTIKYPANMDYGTTNFSVPLPNQCDDEGGVDRYRRKNKQRECCVQIEGPDIDNTMQGINQKLPEGIEICRKGTMDLDSDVFILRMGKKAATADKKGLIEIELRTPKGPTGGRPQLVSISTQVDENMLSERISGLPPGKKNGKGGKKGKGKGKKGKK